MSEPLDLINVQQSTGLLCEDVLNDSVTVIIPMGYGHPDDCIDSEDIELVDVKFSRSLAYTIELAVHNASGKRQIEVRGTFCHTIILLISCTLQPPNALVRPRNPLTWPRIYSYCQGSPRGEGVGYEIESTKSEYLAL